MRTEGPALASIFAAILGLAACGPAPQAPPTEAEPPDVEIDAAARLLPCTYTASRPDAEFEAHADCATRASDGSLTIRPEHLAAIDFSTRPAPLFVDGRWYYVQPSGRHVEALPFDNGPEAFVDGLARGRVDGDIVFVNHQLDVVLTPDYDHVWPFENGYAQVCRGCRNLGGRHHQEIGGGQWGYINRRGVEVVSVVYDDRATARRKLEERGLGAAAERY